MTKHEKRYWEGAMREAEKQGLRVGGLVLIPHDDTKMSLSFALPPGLDSEDFFKVMRAFFAKDAPIDVTEKIIPGSEGNA